VKDTVCSLRILPVLEVGEDALWWGWIYSGPFADCQASGVLLRAHSDTLEETQGDHADRQVTTPVADERQRDAGNRHKPHGHSNVHEDVEQEDGSDADGDQDSEAVSGDCRQVQHTSDKHEEQPDQQEPSDEAGPLRKVGEDKVGVVLRQEA
jgi:hypothetical protein